MPLIWCSISGHGFGHAAQIVPVLNALGRLVPDVQVVLHTTVPDWFFRDRLNIPWEWHRSMQDVGCVQHGPLHIDIDHTWKAYAEFHRNWEGRVKDKVTAISNRSPRLILSDIAYLPLEAGACAGVPTVGLSSLSWDVVLEGLEKDVRRDRFPIIRQIQRAYRYADRMIRVIPAVKMPAFERTVDIAPIVSPAAPDSETLRRALRASSDERVVAVSFGGISLTSLPWERIEQMHGYRFVFSEAVPATSRRIVSADTLPMSVQSIMASSDIVLTKPGYGTMVEAVFAGRRVVYVRRYNFADEEVLLDYLHRFGCGEELSVDDFTAGRWAEAFLAVLNRSFPRTAAPLPTGADEAAEILASYL